MKILKNYKNLVSELFEVDDTKIIKYKDKDGENKEMAAKSAKTMPDEHPAKQAWDKEKDKEDGGEEKPSGQKLSGSDFDRDSGGGKPKEKDDSDSKEAPKEAPSAVNPDLKSQFTDEELEDVPFGHLQDDSFNDKTEEMEQEISMELEQLYGVDKDGEYDDDKAETVRAEAELLYAEFAGQQSIQIPKKIQTLKGYRDRLMKNIENRFAKIEKKPLPHKTGSSYYEKKPAKKNRGTMGSVGIREPGQAGSGMYDSVQPKKKPFLKEQLERIGGGKY